MQLKVSLTESITRFDSFTIYVRRFARLRFGEGFIGTESGAVKPRHRIPCLAFKVIDFVDYARSDSGPSGYS